MAKVVKQRVTAEVDGEFVVFLIGMRINKLWKVWKWFPVMMAMGPMLSELSKKPESGLLGFRAYIGWRGPMICQYWRSFEQLETFSRAKDSTHFPAWVKFNTRVGSGGDVGIWHETYKVAAGQYEAIYNNMPPTGLANATSTVQASGRKLTAASRIGAREEDAYPEEAGLAR